MNESRRPWWRRLRSRRVLLPGLGAIILVLVALPYLLPGPIPPRHGLSIRTEPFPCPPERIDLLMDTTGVDAATGERILDQQIFDRILDQIARADDFIVADFFLWNPWSAVTGPDGRDLALELAAALMARKLDDPDLPILVLTDPINRIYGEDEPGFYREMAAIGIPVVFTDLGRLRDSNRLYAPPARLYGPILSALLTPTGLLDRRWLANPFDAGLEKVSLRQAGRLLFLKANHRKVLVTRSDEAGIELLTGSFNPADGSAAHTNLALQVTGPVAQAALGSELSIARWSARPETVLQDQPDRLEDTIAHILKRTMIAWDDYLGATATARVTWLTEGRIREAIIGILEAAIPGDRIDIALFYLSDRNVIRAMESAARNGVSLRLILDANRDAFGREKIGIPNRPVARELMRLADDHAIEIRWAHTQGEQFHAKAMAVHPGPNQDGILLLGSANWTRRNLGDLNLEANLLVENPGPALETYLEWFERTWANEDLWTTDDMDNWDAGAWTRLWNAALYRLQEGLGAGSF